MAEKRNKTFSGKKKKSSELYASAVNIAKNYPSFVDLLRGKKLILALKKK